MTSGRFPRALVDDLLDRLIARLPPARPLLAGLSGLQASGKSTLARQLVAAAQRRGVPAVAMSLDDFYLTRAERATLAARVHPELATRGPPGTHDVDLLETTLDALMRSEPVRVPRFDKGRDDRAPRSAPLRVPPRLILLDGWFLGAPPQPARALFEPVNAWERRVDPDAILRRFANRALRDRYVFVWRRLDLLIALLAPSFPVSRRWRRRAEAVLRASPDAPRAMSPREMTRFLPRYERLARHSLSTLPGLADIAVALDREHEVRSVVERSWGR